jgi:hypothetical protein
MTLLSNMWLLTDVWRYFIICEITFWCVTLLSNMWHYLLMCDITFWCVTLLSDVWHYFLICDFTYWCVTLLSDVWHYFLISLEHRGDIDSVNKWRVFSIQRDRLSVAAAAERSVETRYRSRGTAYLHANRRTLLTLGKETCYECLDWIHLAQNTYQSMLLWTQ